MKIIQVMPEFGLAGAETMCENLTNALVKKGHKVMVVSLYNYYSPITERLEANGVKIEYLGKKSGLDVSIIKKLRKVFKREVPDVIHTHLYLLKYCFLASYGMNVRLVHTVHNVAKEENNRLDRMINGYCFRHKKVTPVALTDLVKESILDEYGLNAKDVPVVFNGIPLERCVKKLDYMLGERIKILHIGRYSDAKNHPELIKAVASLHQSYPNVELHLIGEGVLKDKVKESIQQCNAGEYVYEHGTTSNPYKYLHESDIFVLPSKYEGMPMTLIEAMGTALPIVASRVGGIPNMIEDNKEGLLCDPNADDIVRALTRLVEDADLRKNLGNAAFKSADRFSADEMAKNYERVYKS